MPSKSVHVAANGKISLFFLLSMVFHSVCVYIHTYTTASSLPIHLLMDKYAKELVEHGDVVALSIYANRLTQRGGDVLHGAIKEVSLVLAGANPQALIDCPILAHSDGTYETIDDEATIYFNEPIELSHAEEPKTNNVEMTHSDEPKESEEKEEEKMAEEKKEKTVQDVFDELTEEQKQVVYFLIGQAIEDKGEAKKMAKIKK